MTFETVQLILAAMTMPVALLFLAAYAPERPMRRWFSASLVLIAIAVFGYCLIVVLYRVFGPDYPGREFLVVASGLLTFLAMTMRTVVLLVEQHKDRRGPGWTYTKPFRALVRYVSCLVDL